MAETKQYEKSLFISNNIGIPSYDYVDITYSVDNDPISIKYYRGGQQDAGQLVGEIELTYDASSNLVSVERKV